MADTKEEILCPACWKIMVKVPTEIGVNVDICVNGCGGIWFDNRELAKLDEEHENADAIKATLNGKTFRAVDKDADRECPVCHKKMVKHLPSPNSKITIDDCYNCGGKFLDYLELENIKQLADSTTEQVETIIKALYRKNGYVPYRAKEVPIRDFLSKFYSSFI